MGRAKGKADDWCILRTQGPRTLRLAAALCEAGIEAWTPSRMQKRRTIRGKKTREQIEVALMPTFVFVRYDRLADLRLALSLPINPYPAFSIFHYLGAIPGVSNREVERLRTEELRLATKGKGPLFVAGDFVRVEEDSFRGMTGEVVKANGRYTFVCFGGAVQFKIATMHLRTDAVHGVQPALAGAAA